MGGERKIVSISLNVELLSSNVGCRKQFSRGSDPAMTL